MKAKRDMFKLGLVLWHTFFLCYRFVYEWGMISLWDGKAFGFISVSFCIMVKFHRQRRLIEV